MPKRYFANLCNPNDLPDKLYNPSFWKPKIQDFLDKIKRNQPPLPQNADGGLYTGTPGIGYLFFHISCSTEYAEVKRDLIAKGVEYCITAEQRFARQVAASPTDYYGFICCEGGVHAVTAVLNYFVGKTQTSQQYIQKYAAASEYCEYKYSADFGCNELFVGRAGYLLGLLWIKKTMQKTVLPIEKINSICQTIIDEGREKKLSGCPLWYTYYGTGYFGAAHGISSILFVLLSFNDFISNYPGAENDVKLSVDYLLSLQMPNGNFPCAIDELPYKLTNTDRELVHWCHGAPGVVYLMAKAYLRWKDDKYLQSCIKCADLVWDKGLLKKGPGLCHGVAGNGYVFLLLYRLTNDIKYVKRAIYFAEFMLTPDFRKNSNQPDAPYSLYEGLAGTVCYLVDLLNPSQAAFPFMDVFYSYNA